jgi:hypothetical protein
MTGPEREDEREPRSFDDWLGSFAREGALRPVLIVAIGCLTAIGAGALLVAVRGRSLPAMAALALLALGSADLLQRDLRRRRFGPAARLVAALWLLSSLTAAAAVWSGLSPR